MLRVMPVAVLITLLLAACASGPTPEPDASETADPTPTVTASETPEPDPEPALSAADRQNVIDAITSGNTAAIEGYLSEPVMVILMSTECCGEISRAEAVAQLSYVTAAPGPWDFGLPATTVDPWHSNIYYGDLFTGDDITGRAADGTIISFGIEGGVITKILMGFEEGFSY
jgi:hypothetical protein